MKMVAAAIQSMSADEIQTLENNGSIALTGTKYVISSEDVDIIAEDVEGWQVANLGRLTVALDVHISAELKDEGMARELINRIQNLRKEKGFEVTDRINVTLSQNTEIQQAVDNNFSYICTEILADSLRFDSALANGDAIEIDGENLLLSIEKI